MARKYDLKFRKQKPLVARQNKWIRGLNTLVSNTQIRNDELSEAVNIQIVEDGKVQVPRDGQAHWGSETGTRVTGLMPYYKSDGTNQLLRTTGTALYKYNTGTDGWDSISGYTYTTGLLTNGVMAYDRMYLVNGTDPLTYYDGTDITSFTAIDPPTSPQTARTAGSAGTYTFSYKVTAVTNVGETLPTAATSITMDSNILDSTHKITVSWTASTGAVGYNVYGRKDGNWYHIKYVEGNTSVSYLDDGTDTPFELNIPPTADTTGGPKGKYIAFFNDALIIAGDPDNPSRLYYSGGGDHVHDFSVAGDGGFVDIAANDGQEITGLILFKNVLLVFKTDSIYQFEFTTTLLSYDLVNSALGCVAPRSLVAVENDVFFASRRGIFTLGNEAGFAFDVLRTNELSAKVRSVFESINQSKLTDISAIYATKQNKNLVIFSYAAGGSTTNDNAIVYDRERLAWYKWTDIQANCWAQYVDADGATHVLYGDDSSGYVKEVLTGSDDFGSAIHGYFRIGAEDFDDLTRYKKYKNVHIALRQPTGNIQVNLITDGVTTEQTASISTISPTVNWGHYVFGSFLFGESTGDGATAQDDNVVRRLRNVNLTARSMLLEFDNNRSSSFVLLETKIEAKAKSEHFYAAGEVL